MKQFLFNECIDSTFKSFIFNVISVLTPNAYCVDEHNAK